MKNSFGPRIFDLSEFESLRDWSEDLSVFQNSSTIRFVIRALNDTQRWISELEPSSSEDSDSQEAPEIPEVPAPPIAIPPVSSRAPPAPTASSHVSAPDPAIPKGPPVRPVMVATKHNWVAANPKVRQSCCCRLCCFSPLFIVRALRKSRYGMSPRYDSYCLCKVPALYCPQIRLFLSKG